MIMRKVANWWLLQGLTYTDGPVHTCVSQFRSLLAGETTLVWDRETGEPLHNAIVWLDNRTSGICHEMHARFGSWDHFRQVRDPTS